MTISAEQRAKRRFGIYSSDAARILMGDAVSLWAEKTGQLEPVDLDDNLVIQLGNMLEEAVAKAAIAELKPDSYELSPETFNCYPIVKGVDLPLGAHLDGTVRLGAEIAVLEVKAHNAHSRGEWGQAGTDQIPERIMWQVQHQMIVSGARRAYVGVTFIDTASLAQFVVKGTVPVELFHVERSPELVRFMLDKYADFWKAVVGDETPNWMKATDLNLIYPRPHHAEIEASDEIATKLSELLTIRNMRKAFEEREDRTEAELKAFMKDAAVLTYHGQELATWRRSKDGTAVDMDRLKREHTELVAQYLIPKTGSRRFVPNEKAQVASNQE